MTEIKKEVLFARYQADIIVRTLEDFEKLGVKKNHLIELEEKTPAVFPWHPEYDSLRLNVNRRIQLFPKMIMMATCLKHVAKALRFARRYKLSVALRGGGHSNECYSLCNGVVIDQSRCTDIMINKDNTVTVAAGVLQGPLIVKLAEHKRMIPSGTCPNVGVIGLTLGGGVGMTMRQFGLTSDSLVSLDMLTTDYRLITANANENSDLFWASQGGGGGQFGIITSMTLKTQPLCRYSIYNYSLPLTELESTLIWFQSMIGVDTRLALEWNATENRIIITGLYLGPLTELDVLLVGLSRYQPELYREVDYPTAAAFFAGASPHRPPLLKNKTLYVDQKWPLEVGTLISKWFTKTPDNCRLELQLMGGAIAKISPTDTAFPHRKALWWGRVSSMWSDGHDSSKHIAWVEGFHNALAPYTTGGTYINFTDADLPHPGLSCSGPNLTRLIAIKERYDPDNVLDFNQSLAREASKSKLLLEAVPEENI